jgi:hypothetical protein
MKLFGADYNIAAWFGRAWPGEARQSPAGCGKAGFGMQNKVNI